MNLTKLISAFCGLTLSCVYTTTFAELLKDEPAKKNLELYGGLLYLQPNSDNLKYAVFVSGNQPYSQSWHYQEIHPAYSPAFEVGLNYNFSASPYQANVNWLHLDTSNSTFKQASQSTDLSTVEFVAPAYEVGPPVFGIKRADSTVKFDFDSIDINASKLFEYSPNLRARLFGGLNILRINQTLTTVFSDYAGAPATPYSYALPPDPQFFFETQNKSEYLGAGPDLGLNVQYVVYRGFGVVGELAGMLTAGGISVVDNFTASSARLTFLGLSPSHQEVTTPDVTQVVTGFDGKLGLFYNYSGRHIDSLTIEAGYRLAYYNNAIAEVSPATLVQAGTVFITPSFATGTMAINSTEARSRNFSVNGPYVNLTLAVA
ncbi:Lpg1974 family pore-forming outer membrane protein [Legionella maioricensis]|uniref:Major outer membrane protein n=1 Tax=Legionella maioricensis TaxID=2896528 RepID=A0A9X2CYH6_9GAMM|nr:Lpg1974 family pore-forming outer membrane protein [Legionella maioricensis]MCL9683024.1 hypothetical protein [Legionella maioricensis]MCL9686372.1 Lpg1974 family pore-forming outer membrane protein [Legionella maioricensis]